MNAAERADRALNRLCKWRTFFAGWSLGTRPDTDGPTRALRDATDARLIARAELSAMSQLLIEKGLCTADEFTEAVAREADFLAEMLAKQYPGFEATDAGLQITPRAADTMRRLGFPP